MLYSSLRNKIRWQWLYQFPRSASYELIQFPCKRIVPRGYPGIFITAIARRTPFTRWLKRSLKAALRSGALGTTLGRTPALGCISKSIKVRGLTYTYRFIRKTIVSVIYTVYILILQWSSSPFSSSNFLKVQ